MLLIFVVIEIVCAVTVYKNNVNDYTACLGWTDLLLQLDQTLILLFFIVLGYFISRQINEQK